MINDTYEQLLAKKAPKAEGVGTDDDREAPLARNRQLGFDRPIDPVNVTEVVNMRPRRSGADPANSRAPRSPMLSSMSRPAFRTARSTAGTQLQLRPRIRHGKFAIHGPGDLAPKFRFHDERIATIVAGMLDRRTRQKHSISQSEPDIPPLQQ